MHHNATECESSQVIRKVQNIVDYASRANKLFPKELKLVRVYNEKERFEKLKANGGWADIRDHLLCLNMTSRHFSSNAMLSKIPSENLQGQRATIG